MKNKSVLQSILTGVFAVLVLAASNSIVRASTTTWTYQGVTGDWFECDNWSSGCPNGQMDAYINNGGEAQILADIAYAESVHLGDSQGDSGSVEVDGTSTILYPGPIYVGNRGSGNLSISNGGHVDSQSAYVAPLLNGSSPNSNGIVNVNGSGAILRADDGLFIGCTATSNGVGGTASVDVSNGGSIIVYRSQSDDPGVIVGLSGTLTGNGTLLIDYGASSSKTVKVFGTLAPKTGSLTINGDVDLTASTANTVCHVTPTANDSVIVSSAGGGGVAKLGGRVTVIMSGNFSPGMSFNLLHAGASRDLTFASESIISFSSGTCYTPTIEYDGNDVNLYLSPTCQ